MIRGVRSPEDLGAGVLMIAVAGGFLFFAQDLHHGALAQMGPGYLPRYVAGMLAATGAVLALRGLRLDGQRLPPLRPRAIAMPILAVVVFGLMIEPLGLALASLAAVLTAAAGCRRDDWLRTTLVAVVLAAGACLLFVALLDMPLAVFPTVLQ
ncbi:tripartite tricarboxylate transporter TctB family protein [Chelatococcus asaccharovorans]|uniref:tripartite tricarboxylate transporter TctB family protein n=1 Tax=Chelatococcus asaccharovorans TaxID=28210 RepID=UPI00224C75EF|nr:tripartite tricarboxylate transporter TctB family protein [Chelatococcus asaccharovorans]CAH1669466.1 putative tricarboxylic transport membrane protein [Chelatococcus asaccharovorans]CAH1679106.1 putative tricarboxylic transport membrane protein [Chelatococcus asaccharovorans]